MDYQTWKQSVLADPSTSYWLRGAIEALENRDPVDAAHDAELIAIAFKSRAAEILSRPLRAPRRPS